MRKRSARSECSYGNLSPYGFIEYQEQLTWCTCWNGDQTERTSHAYKSSMWAWTKANEIRMIGKYRCLSAYGFRKLYVYILLGSQKTQESGRKVNRRWTLAILALLYLLIALGQGVWHGVSVYVCLSVCLALQVERTHRQTWHKFWMVNATSLDKECNATNKPRMAQPLCGGHDNKIDA